MKLECLKCGFFNPEAKDFYRCKVHGCCPALYGAKEFREGRLARALNPEGDQFELCPYKYELGNDSEGNHHGVKSALWYNGWRTD
jgi:CO dehydrogenase/acetyl-CoA synthase beta subunit